VTPQPTRPGTSPQPLGYSSPGPAGRDVPACVPPRTVTTQRVTTSLAQVLNPVRRRLGGRERTEQHPQWRSPAHVPVMAPTVWVSREDGGCLQSPLVPTAPPNRPKELCSWCLAPGRGHRALRTCPHRASTRFLWRSSASGWVLRRARVRDVPTLPGWGEREAGHMAGPLLAPRCERGSSHAAWGKVFP